MVGVSLGAWIAAEIAIKSTARLSHLVLANAVGIKVGDRETRDIVDIFAITEPELNELAYFDPKLAERDYKAMAEADVRIVARNREATARYGWSPYMHDPKLKGRLHRIRIPTLFLWGTADRILTGGLRARLLRRHPGRALRDRSSAPGIIRISSSPTNSPAGSSPSRRTTRNESLSFHRASLSATPGTIRTAICASICRTGRSIRRSRPICSIAITTSICSPTSSAST